MGNIVKISGGMIGSGGNQGSVTVIGRKDNTIEYPAPAIVYTHTVDNLTPDDVAGLLGKPAPTYMWRGNDASGATELVSGSDNLSDVDTPIKSGQDTLLYNAVITEFDSVSDGMIASTGSVADATTDTVTVMWIGRLEESATEFKNILQKREGIGEGSGNSLGWEITTFTQGHIGWFIDSTTGTQSNNVEVDHGTINPQVFLATRSVTDDVSGLWTREGSSTSTVGAGGSVSNNISMSVGADKVGVKNTDAMLATCGVIMIWIGPNGDGFTEADRLIIAKALRFE